MYTTVGIPESHKLVTAGIDVALKFMSISPVEVSTGGSLITGKIIGAGTGDKSSLIDGKGNSICLYNEILVENEVRCLLKPGASLSTIKVSLDDKVITCTGCSYTAKDAGYPAVSSAVGSVAKKTSTTIEVTGTDFPTSDFTSTLKYGGVSASSVTINSATKLTATFT